MYMYVRGTERVIDNALFLTGIHSKKGSFGSMKKDTKIPDCFIEYIHEHATIWPRPQLNGILCFLKID